MKVIDWPKEKIDNMGKTTPSIENIKKFLNLLDNPEKKIPPVIHITGTNGKGSTSSFLKFILEKNGYKVHRFISPHLVDINERIELAGKPINDEYLKELVNECKSISEKNKIKVSYFEGITSIAFLVFSRIPADVLILEVGMGGTWDATNVVEQTLASIITPISLDHMHFLGNTTEEIAKEKAGIFKKNCPAIISKQENSVYNILIENAKSKNCPIFQYDKEWKIEDSKDGFIFKFKDKVLNLPKPSLIGKHQYINSATAIMALLVQNTLKITDQSIVDGITSTFWPARLQNLNNTNIFKKYLNENFELWLDGGHNEGGARVIKDWLDEEKTKTVIIFSMLKRKDPKKYLSIIKDSIDYAIAVNIHNTDSEIQNKEDLLKYMKELNIDSISKETVQEALFHVEQKFKDEKIRVLICGSLYLAGEVLALK